MTHVGMDVHARTIRVAVLAPGGVQREEWGLANEPRAVARLARRLLRDAPGRSVLRGGPHGLRPCAYTPGEGDRLPGSRAVQNRLRKATRIGPTRYHDLVKCTMNDVQFAEHARKQWRRKFE